MIQTDCTLSRRRWDRLLLQDESGTEVKRIAKERGIGSIMGVLTCQTWRHGKSGCERDVVAAICFETSLGLDIILNDGSNGKPRYHEKMRRVRFRTRFWTMVDKLGEVSVFIVRVAW